MCGYKRVSAEDGESIRRHWKNAADHKGMLQILRELFPMYTKEAIQQAINHNPFREVEKQYQQIKENKTMAKKKTWDKATIDAAVKAVLVDGERTGEVGERYGVPPSTLGKWLTDARNKRKEFMDYAEKTEKELAEEKDAEPEDKEIDWQRLKPRPEPVFNRVEETQETELAEPVYEYVGEDSKPAVDEKAIKAAAYDVITKQMALHPDSSTDEMMCFIQGVQALAQQLCSEV